MPAAIEPDSGAETAADARTLAELADLRRLVAREAADAERARGEAIDEGGRGWTIAMVAMLILAAILRFWGLQNGLPFAYNVDEAAHFLPRAIGMFGHGGDPDYFVNPPAFTYVMHVVLSVWFGGRAGVYQAYIDNPTAVWTVARACTALIGVGGVWLMWRAGIRLLGRPSGLLAAGMLTTSFLAVFYSHEALNDVPTLAPIILALWGGAGLLIGDRRRDWILAGIGLGLAIATKYTGGIVILPLIVAAVHRGRVDGWSKLFAGLAWVGLASAIAFIIFNPYALITPTHFFNDLVHQQDTSGDSEGKLGLTQTNGYLYYIGVSTWGLGWIPSIFAVFGAAVLWVRDRTRFFFLVPATVIYILFMGSQVRFFGRWLIPVIPMIALLAAVGALAAVELLRGVKGRRDPRVLAVLLLLLCGQGLIYSIHSSHILAKQDTRGLARNWMFQNIPAGAKIVLEPIVPSAWSAPIGKQRTNQLGGNHWVKYTVGKSQIDPATGGMLATPQTVAVEDFERILRPDLVSAYQRGGFCLVIVGSTQRGRAEAEPDQVPKALAYYKALEQNSSVIYHVSPYADPKAHVPFSFDWSFVYEPLKYVRPGPEITIYRLRGGRCGDGKGPLSDLVSPQAAARFAQSAEAGANTPGTGATTPGVPSAGVDPAQVSEDNAAGNQPDTSATTTPGQ